MATATTSVATSLSWQTPHSRTSIGSLSCAAFSDQQSRLVNGLEDVIRAVRSLKLLRFRYEDLAKENGLGEGETYRVEKCGSQSHTVAVKHLKLNQDGSDQATFRRRLRSVVMEIQVMKHPPLNAHPNVPSVLGYGWNTLNNTILPFIVVEYAGLGTLREYIKGHDLCPETHLRDIEILLGDVVSGLSALHTCGIVHGDVKLDNVLVVPSRDSPAQAMAKIADFGHAIVLNDVDKKESEGRVRYRGTMIYNAPEIQFQDDRLLDHSELLKCDVWALGLLVWEACIKGEEYLSHMKKYGLTKASDDGGDCILYRELRQFAKASLPGSRITLGAVMFLKITLHKALEEDPSRRAASARDMPICTTWNTGSLRGVAADLALHLETPLPTYEMFRLDSGREISWEHQQQIFNGLEQIRAGKLAKESNVFTWQLSLSYYQGFGIARNTTTAYHFAKLAQADHHPLALLFADLFAITPSMQGAYADCVVGLLRSTNICSAWPPLVQAGFAGDVSAVLSLLKAGADPNTCTIDGCGLFHWLFMISDPVSLSLVVEAIRSRPGRAFPNDCFITTRDIHSQWPLQLLGSPLAIAISVNSELGVRTLLDLGADPLSLAYGHGCFPKSDPRSHWTAFHIAVKYHCIEILQLMLDRLDDSDKGLLKDIYPLASALSFSTGLERLAMHGIFTQEHLHQTIAFIAQWQKIDEVQPNGMTSLTQAIDFEDHEVVSALLQVDPNLARTPLRSPDGTEEFNFPIHFAVQLAARRDTPETLEIPRLINAHSQDFDPHVAPRRDSIGRTALHLAVTGGSDRTAKWILEQRVGLLQVEDQNGRTPLHYCNSAATCHLLLGYNGVNVNHADRQGMTTLHKACYLGHHELAEALLKYQPKLNLVNYDYGPPLHCAIISRSVQTVLLLLDAGAPLDMTDAQGNTASDLAARLDRHIIMRLLQRRQSKSGAIDRPARDALAIAMDEEPFGSRAVPRDLQDLGHSKKMLEKPSYEELQSEVVQIEELTADQLLADQLLADQLRADQLLAEKLQAEELRGEVVLIEDSLDERPFEQDTTGTYDSLQIHQTQQMESDFPPSRSPLASAPLENDDVCAVEREETDLEREETNVQREETNAERDEANVKREEANANFVVHETYDDRKGGMTHLQTLALHIALQVQSKSGKLDGDAKRLVVNVVSVYFDETVWRSPTTDRFHKVMMCTANTLRRLAQTTDETAAKWTARIVAQTRPDGAFPRKNELDLAAMILGELRVIGMTEYGVAGLDDDWEKAQLRMAAYVVDEFWKWLGYDHAAARQSTYDGYWKKDVSHVSPVTFWPAASDSDSVTSEDSSKIESEDPPKTEIEDPPKMVSEDPPKMIRSTNLQGSRRGWRKWIGTINRKV